MPDTKNIRPEDKTILKTADDVVNSAEPFVPYLVIADGPKQGTRFELKEGDNLIGRSPASAAILEDQSVSRKQAIVTRSRTGWTLQDAGSKNGSKLNGQKIVETVNIGHNDIIQVGIYSLRLITKRVTQEEELADLPAEVAEGKTLMYSQSQKEPSPTAGTGATDTRTMAETPESEKKTEDFTPETGKLALAESDTAGGKRALIEGDTGAIPEPVEIPDKRNPLFTYLSMGLSLLIVIAIGGYAYWKYLSGPSAPKVPVPTEAPKVLQAKPPEAVPQKPSRIPVFIDFASSPMPARVMFEGKDNGTAPFKVNMELEPGKTYTAQGIFNLEEMSDTIEVVASFTVEETSTAIPILFKAPIGIVKVADIPKDTQLYIEGYYASDPYKPRTAKFSEVVFNKPIYIPYGKYSMELRQPKKLGESNQYVEDIRYKREAVISEDSPIFELNVSDTDLNTFPIEVKSLPENADLFVDGVLVGKTPYKGVLQLGQHTLTFRKDGYFEQTQEITMDINMLYTAEVTLKTTEAGEYINAGNMMLSKGLYNDAIAQLSEAFKHNPTPRETGQIQYLLASTYIRLGDLATSAGYFQQAKQVEEFYLPSILGLASIYGAQRDMANALPLLVEVMLKAQDEKTKADANAVFKQVSPLRSVMYIWTEPDGATVTVNEKQVGQKTPMILHDLGLGNYKIHIQKEGYKPQDLNINMSLAEFNPVIVKLKPVEE